jgi:hypothetical protein
MKKGAGGFKTSKMENKKKQETKLALEELIRGIRKPNATHSTKNAEVEGQEHGKDAMGNVTKFVGEKHEDGGMPMQLEDGEKILSDNEKPNKDYKKLLEEKYKVNIAPKDTYASILDKINSKIGFKKIEDEQLKIADKLEKNDKVKDENTKMLNEQAYQKRLGDLEMIKEFKNEKKEEAFDDLYEMQEEGKIEDGEYIDDESGVEVRFENGGMMFKKGHLPLLTRVKLTNGYRTQEEINNHFSNKFKSGGMKKKNYYAEGGLYGISAIDAYLKSKSDRPTYDYGDLPATYQRFKELADKRNIKYDDINPKDLASLGKLAGRTQKYDFENTPDLAIDYGLDVPLTKSGVDLLLKNPTMVETLKKSAPTLLAKLQGTGRGMLENKFTEEDSSYISDLVRATGDDKFKENFAKVNYNDNKAYFRGIDKNEIVFNDENEYNKYLQENAKNKIGDYYKTSKSGIYIKPIFKKADAPSAVVQQKAESTDTATTTPATKDETPLPQRLNNPRYNMSVQHTPPPSGLQLPMLINPQVRDQTFTKISPEQAIRENQRGLNYMGEQLRETESGTQGAAFANLAGKMFEANNEAVSTSNIWNANQRVNYDNQMSQRLDNYDAQRMNNLAQYVNQSQLAEQNTFNDWRTYFMDRDIIERKAQKDAQLMNMYEALTPNQNLDPRTGKITYTKPTFGQWIQGYNS